MRKLLVLPALLLIILTLTSSGDKENLNTVKEITEAEFLQKVVNYNETTTEWKYLGEKPAILDFYTTWCPYCKPLAKRLEKMAQEYGDKIVIYKIDAEKEPNIAKQFGVKAYPTVVFIPMEGMPQIAEGALSRKDLEEITNKML